MPEVTRLQLLLLHSARTCTEIVRALVQEGEMNQAAWFGFPFPFEREEIARDLHTLCRQGYIILEDEALYPDDESYQDDSLGHYHELYRVSDPDLETVREALERTSSIRYLLTPEGGAVWEKAVNADWNRYTLYSGYEQNEEEAQLRDYGDPYTATLEFTSISKENLQRTTRRSSEWGFREIEGSRIESEVGIWKPTYWKTLPYGYRIRFEARYDSSFMKRGRVKIHRWFNYEVLGFGQQ